MRPGAARRATRHAMPRGARTGLPPRRRGARCAPLPGALASLPLLPAATAAAWGTGASPPDTGRTVVAERFLAHLEAGRHDEYAVAGRVDGEVLGDIAAWILEQDPHAR